MPSALVLIADGTEEMEFTIPYDTLVRGGIACTSALIQSPGSEGANYAVCSRGVKIVPDTHFSPDDCGPDTFDALLIPGGVRGAETISQSVHVQRLVREYIAHDKLVGMICAGTLTALTSKLPRQPLTSHPSVKSRLDKDFEYSEEPVVVSGKLVTSRGPGTAFAFALTIVELLCGAAKRAEVRQPMVFPQGTLF